MFLLDVFFKILTHCIDGIMILGIFSKLINSNDLYSIKSYTNDLWRKHDKEPNSKDSSKDERTWLTDTWDVASNLSDALIAGLDPNKGLWDASNDPRYQELI